MKKTEQNKAKYEFISHGNYIVRYMYVSIELIRQQYCN